MEKQAEELILEQLTRVEQNLDKVRTEDIPSLRERIKTVEVKSSTIAAIAGIIGGALTTVAALLMKFM